ncbi:hypothetical protein BDN72DRAFT_849107 [Pluteus cervinus]|uniref:Uncharacterized protein n=1 Tax=Pluteus cervinus TaxID=181527 RepID=A0ACD3A838_9AGAR|nr:hypothetical protein BDN72DRAFT_849107 [Pluteus cervinus]
MGGHSNLRVYLGLGHKRHKTTWEGIRDFIDECNAACMDLSALAMRVTVRRYPTEVEKVIDRVREAYPALFPIEQDDAYHEDLENYILRRANEVRGERHRATFSAHAFGAASAEGLPDSNNLGTEALGSAKKPLPRTARSLVKSKRSRTKKQKPSAKVIGTSVSAIPQVNESSSITSQRGYSPLSLEYPPTPPISMAHAEPRLLEVDETGPTEKWLPHTLRRLYPYLVQYGCTSTEYIEAMACLSDDELEKLIEDMKARAEKASLPHEKPKPLDWFLFRREIREARRA